MDFEKSDSGLLTPKEKPKKPKRKYGPTEITDEKKREMAKLALLKLWDSMDLTSGGSGIRLPDEPSNELCETYYQIYHFIGEFLLGKDCPEKEILC